MAKRKSLASMEFAIGTAIIIAIILLVCMLTMWGNSSSFLRKHYRVSALLDNVDQLKEGAPVKLGGLQIGTVSTIELLPDGRQLEVVMNINESRKLPIDSRVQIAKTGLVGDEYVEVLPGSSHEFVKLAKSPAEADTLAANQVSDPWQTVAKADEAIQKVSILLDGVNDILGDVEFRQNLKHIASNINTLSVDASTLVQSGKDAMSEVLETVKILRQRVDTITSDISAVTGKTNEIFLKTESLIDNVNSRIDDIGRITSDEQFAAAIKETIANLREISTSIAARRPETEKLLENLAQLSDDFKQISGKLRSVSDQVDPMVVSETIASLSGAIRSMTDVVDKIKAEPVLALSVNKAADRIVKMKFDELSKLSQYKSADETLREITRWVRENMNRGYFTDPAWQYSERPYTFTQP